MKPSKTSLVLGVGTVVFALVCMALLTQRSPVKPIPRQALIASLKGKLKIGSVDDFSVNRQKVILCGVQFMQGSDMKDLVTQAARTSFQNKNVICNPVGGGTPCDGNVAPRFGNAIVVQCALDDGRDLAKELIANHYFCGNSKQSGGVYTDC